MSSAMPDPSGEDRILQLVERFTHIGETAMRELPIYNHALQVDAIGFKPMAAGWLGVLITPWFINVVLLPKQKQEATIPLGEKVTHELISGEHEFIVGEDDELGRYDFLTLASPTLKYKSHQAACDAAQKALTKLLTPADEARTAIPEQPVHFVTAEQKGKERRAFLRGLIPGERPSDVND
jgi:[NiFe] hydrogenase assembly HybE family chaperone